MEVGKYEAPRRYQFNQQEEKMQGVSKRLKGQRDDVPCSVSLDHNDDSIIVLTWSTIERFGQDRLLVFEWHYCPCRYIKRHRLHFLRA
jgi:hypothetical protein